MSPSASRRRISLLMLLLAALVALVALAGCGSGGDSGSGSGSSGKSTTSVAKPAGMASIAESALPAEARDVIKRIDDGGTFQYRQDGVTFQNRERRLPSEPSGYYREYTVATPGAADRGARRLILGRKSELYYTPDHYRSFMWVLRGGTP
ncbi:ribonuclease N [Catenulispora sp. NF23]|uniref:Ribonuclease N n=1 Tax=Catenulispora pinistramenti TaxID=2705254 RepID=A0ABS5L4D4_9ACTN|nr:ribonuclease domain-containing protein [Catenulispora pinistramenti]MBS2536841.1 ribonuclease N [Catenulispora pinistramenti]MBS2553227.1 ribonuclease N [Catenulispora pinistramenti]